MIRDPIKTRWRILLGIASVLVMLLGYTWLAHQQHVTNPDDTTIPTWSQLGDGVKQAVEVNRRSETRWFVEDLKASTWRLSLGILLGVCGAVVLGLLMGCFSLIESVLQPPVSLLAKIPPTAALAVFFVLTQTDMQMYIAMISFGILPVLAQSVYLSVREVPNELMYKAYTLGASSTELVWNVIVRMILPKLIDAIRLQIGPAIVYLIAAEMVFGDVGFGYRIRLQQKLLNMSVVYPYLAVLAGIGFGMDHLLRGIQRLLCPWYAGDRK